MPTYVYRREDGTKFEIKQRITEDPLEECPETGQSVERIIAGSAGLIFKGDGFYITDYGKNGSGRNGGTKATDGTTDETSDAAAGTADAVDSATPASDTSKSEAA